MCGKILLKWKLTLRFHVHKIFHQFRETDVFTWKSNQEPGLP